MTVEEQGELNSTAYLNSLLRHIARQRMARARREGEAQVRQEGRQEGEQRTLLAVASRIVSTSEMERLSALPLEQLRVEVEARIAALAGQQRQV